MHNTDRYKKNEDTLEVLAKGKQFLPLIRHHHVTHIYSQYVFDTTIVNAQK